MKLNPSHSPLKKSLAALAVFQLSLAVVTAATLSLKDGSRIEGELQKIHEGTLYFETGFAGVLEIPQDQVEGLQSDTAVALRTQTGEVFEGPVEEAGADSLVVQSSAGEVSTRISEVDSAWGPGERDPVAVAREAAVEAQLRKWSFQASVDVSGSDGNSDDFFSAIGGLAKLEGPNDVFMLYGEYRYKEADGVATEDEQLAGIRYTNFFTERLGWFVREELERDVFEGIEFRSTTGAGLTYRFIKEERLTLNGSAGLSYRYESYLDSGLDSESFPGLDFELDLGWQFADWGRLSTQLSYLPSVDDFGDYLLEHESGIDIPLDTDDNWIMRFGLSNTYNSDPSGNRDELDTEYFVRLILNWD